MTPTPTKASAVAERTALVGWVLDFLRRDLATLTAKDWSELQRGLDHLAFVMTGAGAVFPVTWLRELAAKGQGGSVTVRWDGWDQTSAGTRLRCLDERRHEHKFRARLPTLRSGQLRYLQRRLRKVLAALRPVDDELDVAASRITYAAFPGGTAGLYLMNDLSDASGRGLKRVYGAEWRHVRWLALVALLEECGTHVVRCQAPGCPELFLRHRRQQYCSKKCSQMVRSAAWYAEHRTAANRKRRQAYRDRLRRARTRR